MHPAAGGEAEITGEGGGAALGAPVGTPGGKRGGGDVGGGGGNGAPGKCGEGGVWGGLCGQSAAARHISPVCSAQQQNFNSCGACTQAVLSQLVCPRQPSAWTGKHGCNGGTAGGGGGTVGKMQVDMLGEAQRGQLSFGYD